MCEITKVKTYILFFDLETLGKDGITIDQVDQSIEIHKKGKEKNFLFYVFDKLDDQKFCIKSFSNSKNNITFKEFRTQLKQKIKTKPLGYTIQVSDLDDSQFIDNLQGFNKEIIEKPECVDIWMNLIIISPIALFLTTNKTFARGEFIGYNGNIQPKAFLLKYPENGSPENSIKEKILESQFNLEPHPIFSQYSFHQVDNFIKDYYESIVSIIEKNKVDLLYKMLEDK